MSKRGKKSNIKQFYQPGEQLGWHAADSQTRRRKIALASRNGNYLAVARALQALANVTRDEDTRRKARADALYFYRQYARVKREKQDNRKGKNKRR